jgi:hypothetical protein
MSIDYKAIAMTKTQTKLLEALITAGQGCSNRCYDFSSGVVTDPNIKRSMYESSKAWDKALAAFRQAQTRQL